MTTTLRSLAFLAAALMVVPLATANSPPTVPTQPTGPTAVKENESAAYCTTRSTDPDGDEIQYVFDFHDGSPLYVSHSTCAYHRWATPGTFCVDVYAQDTVTRVPARSPCLHVTVEPDSCIEVLEIVCHKLRGVIKVRSIEEEVRDIIQW